MSAGSTGACPTRPPPRLTLAFVILSINTLELLGITYFFSLDNEHLCGYHRPRPRPPPLLTAQLNVH